MPSIPQSLLWISLVVLWLFVLVPMLISKRENVRRTSDVALATRVLNSQRGARLLRKRRPAAGHDSDPHWRPSENLNEFGGDDDVTAPRKTVVLAAAAVAAEPDYLDVDVVEEDSGALPIGVSAVQSELPLDLEGDDQAVEDDVVEEDVREFDDSTAAIRTPSDVDFEGDELARRVRRGRTRRHRTRLRIRRRLVGTGGGLGNRRAPGRLAVGGPPQSLRVQDRRGRQRPQVPVPQAHAAGDGRSLLVATAVVAYVVTPAMWWACGSIGAVTLLYLAYLRRQTRIEEQLRRRRAQRMARSRLGVENTQDSEFDVVPARLRRPGSAVLEIDDEDPIFEHLEYATYAEYRLPHAAGE